MGRIVKRLRFFVALRAFRSQDVHVLDVLLIFTHFHVIAYYLIKQHHVQPIHVLQPEDQFHLLPLSLLSLSLHALLRNQTFCKLSERQQPADVTRITHVCHLVINTTPVQRDHQSLAVRAAMRLTIASFLCILLSQVLASEEK